MKIALTGATGFIGSRLARLLVASGHEVVAIDIYPPDEGSGVGAFSRCDVRNRAALTSVVRGCESIFHLAAAHHDFGISTRTFNDVNVEGMRNVCAAATEVGIHDICFYSTVAVFGSATPPLRETTQPQPLSDYGRSKLEAEHVLKEWSASREGNRALVMRPTVTFGPGNYANMFSLIRQIESGKYVQIGKCENVKSLSYVENLTAATLFAWQRIERAPWEVYNYVEKPDFTSKQIAEAIFEALGKKPLGFSVPYTLAPYFGPSFGLADHADRKELCRVWCPNPQILEGCYAVRSRRNSKNRISAAAQFEVGDHCDDKMVCERRQAEGGFRRTQTASAE